MKGRTILVLMIAVVAVFAAACKGSDDRPKKKGNSTGNLSDSEKINLYDKVWYAQGASGGLDLEFLSDGTFRQAKSLEGSWSWSNNGDTMKVEDYQKKKFLFLFDEISETIMKYRSNGGGDEFKTQFTYGTSK
jgi:hypothetical protein